MTTETKSKKLVSPVIETGRNIDGLINSINDGNQEVREEIHKSLYQIGEKEPLMTLSKCLGFLNSSSRSNKNHRVLVMNVMSDIVNKNDFKWSNELGEAIIIMGVQEIISEQSVDSHWQIAASSLLISMARIYPKLVATELLDYFPANTPPHYFIVKTLADFSFKYRKFCSFSILAVSFLPYLKEILTRALPILAMLKHDNLRWVFSASIGRWAEAIIVATNDPNNKNSILISEFASSMNTALKHILNEWMLQMSTKIRLASAEGIGYMSHIIEKEHMGQILDKLIQAYLKLLKSEYKEQLPVTIGLSNVIESVIRNSPDSLGQYLEVLIQTCHQNLCLLNRPENEMSQKNHDTFLKCFELMGKSYADKVVLFLLKQIESQSINIRIGTLEALRHLVSKLKKELKDFKELIVGGVRLIVKTEDYRARLDLVKLICEMGKKGYLSKQGGNELLMVVIRGCSIDSIEIENFDKKFKKDGKYPQGVTSPSEIKDECDKILFGFSENNMSKKMDKVFWPFIFESFNTLETTPSFAILCKVVSDVAKRKKDDKDFMIDFISQVNLPKSHQILARLILMLNEPYGRNNPGVNILRCLYCLSPLFHEELIDAWAKLLPEMKKYLDDTTNFVQDQWENMVLQFVKSSIQAVGDDEWACKLGDAMMQSSPLYTAKRPLKKALLSITGLIIQKTNLKEFVFRAINDLFFLADHNNDEERLGCARGYGQAAQVHTDPVLTHLSTVMKTSIKTSGFFYTLKPTDVTSGAKASALLSYGYATMLIPLKLITARIEVYIIQNILPTLKETKFPEIKENGLKGLDLICKAIHPSRVPDFILKSRDDIISTVLGIIKKTETGPNINKLRCLGLETLSTLLKLPPKIDTKLQTQLLEGTLFIYGIKAEDTQTEDTLLENLNTMLISLLHTDISEQMLNDLLVSIEPYTKNSDSKQREKSMNSYICLLKEFALKISENKPKEKGFNNCGRIIGELIPRITETSTIVRKLSLDGIYLILRIHYFLEKDGNDLPNHIKKLGPLRSEIESVSQTLEIFEIAKKLATILSEAVISQHLPSLMTTLLNTMGDVELNGSNGSCVVLNVLIKIRGKELESQTNTFIKTILKNMESYPKDVIINGLLHCVKGLSKHHPAIVIKTLLNENYPHSKEVVKSLQIFTSDKDLNIKLLETLLDTINNSQCYEEKTISGPTDMNTGKETFITQLYPTPQPISATAALHEILEMSEMNELSKEYYSRILCCILIRIGISNGCTHQPPTKDSQKAFSNFLLLSKQDEILKMLQVEKVFDLLLDVEQYPTAIKRIMTLICTTHPNLVKEHFNNTKGFINRNYLGHRIPSTCIISILLKYIKEDRELIHNSVNSLLGRCGTDEDIKVKIHAIEGLSGIVYHPKDQMSKFITPVVGSLLSNFEDKDEKIILESMKSMKEVLLVAEDEFVSPLLLNVCVRLKPSFEKPNPEIREVSIDLFSVMARFYNGNVGDSIINTIHSNLPILILHLLDDNDQVVKSSKRAIRKLVSVLGSKNLITLFEDKQFDENSKVDFDKFSIDYSELWIKDFPNRISDLISQLVLFFRSDWVPIIGGSALITGYILAKCNQDLRSRTNLKHACSSLILLLKNTNPSVRNKASKVLGLMYES